MSDFKNIGYTLDCRGITVLSHEQMQERRDQEHEAEREHIAECQRLARLESQPGSPSPIRDAIAHIEGMTKQINGGMELIAERLDLVLKPPSPRGDVNAPKPAAQPLPMSPVEQRLRLLAASLEALNTRMQLLYGRIDL